MIGGANGDVTVPIDYNKPHTGSNLYVIKPPYSHYKIKYILRYYEYVIANQINVDPEIKDPDFQIFMKTVSSLTQKIAEAEKYDSAAINANKLTESFVNKFLSTDPNRNYADSMKDRITKKDLNKITKLIIDSYQYWENPPDPKTRHCFTYSSGGISIHPLISWDGTELHYGISDDHAIFDFYFKDFPSGSAHKTQIKIDKLEALRTKFTTKTVTTKTGETLTPIGEQDDAEYNKTLAYINNTILYGNYESKYIAVEELLNKMANLLNRILTASYTEVNIIENTPDISEFYENLKFVDGDIQGAINYYRSIESDLVPYNEEIENIRKSIKKIKSVPIKDTFSALGIGQRRLPTVEKIQELNEQSLRLLKEIGTKEIPSTDEYLQLMRARIFEKLKSKKQRAKYLTPTQVAKKLQNTNVYQNTFLDNITTAPDSRLLKYEAAYQPILLQSGGSQNKYQFRKPYTQTVTQTQSGGNYIVFDNQLNKLNSEFDDLKKINNQLVEINQDLRQLTETFFNNKSVFDQSALEQRNYYLIEMMNNLATLKFLATLNDNEFGKFRNEFVHRLNKFRKQLTEFWTIMNGKILPEESQNILSDLVAQGYFSEVEFQNFLKSKGLILNRVNYPDDIVLNSLPYINTISALLNTPLTLNQTVDALKRIAAKKINLPDTSKSNEELYNDLYVFYSDLKDVSTNIDSARQVVLNQSEMINKLTENMGEVIDRNIQLANTFIGNIIVALNHYDRKINLLGDVSGEIIKAKNELDKTDTYLSYGKEIVSRNRKNNFAKEFDTFFDRFPIVDRTLSMQKIYDDYKNYINGSMTYSQQLLPYFSINRELWNLNNSTKLLADKLENIVILSKLIYRPGIRYVPSISHELLNPSNPNLSSETDFRIENIKNMARWIRKITATEGKISGLFNGNNIVDILSLKANVIVITKFMSGDVLSLFPDILNKLNIPYEIKQTMRLFPWPGQTLSKNISLFLERIKDNLEITSTDATSSLPTTFKLKTDNVGIEKILQMINNAKGAIDIYLNGLTKFSAKNKESANNLENLRNYMTSLTNQINSSDIDEQAQLKLIYDFANDLSTRIESIRDSGDYIINNNKYNDEVGKYIDDLQKIRNETGPGEQNYLNYWIRQIRILGTSLVETLYNEVYELYTLLASFAEKNSSINPHFREIVKSQHEVASLRPNIDKLKFAPLFGTVTYSPDNLWRGPGNPLEKVFNTPSDPQTLSRIQSVAQPYGQYTNTSLKLLRLLQEQNNQLGNVVPTNTIDTKISSISPLKYVYDVPIIPTMRNGTQIIDPYVINHYDYNIHENFVINFVDVDKPFKITGGKIIPNNTLSDIIKLIRTGEISLEIIPNLYLVKDILDKYQQLAVPAQCETANHDLLVQANNLLGRVDLLIRNNLSDTLFLNSLLPESKTTTFSNIDYQKIDTILDSINTNIIRYCDILDLIYVFLERINSYYLAYFLKLVPVILSNGIHVDVINDIITPNAIAQNYSDLMNLQKIGLTKNVMEIPKSVTNLTNEFANVQSQLNSKIQLTLPSNSGIYDDYYSTYDSEFAKSLLGLPYILMMLSKTSDPVGLAKQLEEQAMEIVKYKYATDGFINSGKIINEILEKFDVSNPDKMAKKLLKNIKKSLANSFLEYFETGSKKYLNEVKRDFATYKSHINNLLARPDPGIDPTPYLKADHTLDSNAYAQIIGDATIDDQITTAKFRLNAGNKNASNKTSQENFLVKILEYIYRNEIPKLIAKNNTLLTNANGTLNEIGDRNLHDYLIKILIRASASNLLDINDVNWENNAINNPQLAFNSTKPVPEIVYICCQYLPGRYEPVPEELENKLEATNVILSEFASIKSNITAVLTKQKNILDLASNLENELRFQLVNDRNKISDQIELFRNTMSILNEVMFDEYFSKAPFVPNNKLTQRLLEIVDNYQIIENKIKQKRIDIIDLNNFYSRVLAQQNNYLALKAALQKKIGPTDVPPKIYKYMSFGLIEYYYDIMNTILNCLDENYSHPENLSEVYNYFYIYHYITLKRVHALFKWIDKVFRPAVVSDEREQQLERLSSGAPPIEYPLLKKKIELGLTDNIINSIFIEFNAIKDYLDMFKSTIMPKVSLHLRINDFQGSARENAVEPEHQLRDYDASSAEYDKILQDQVFISKPDFRNKLLVKFNNIPELSASIPEESKVNRQLTYQNLYRDVWDKMHKAEPGIEFERIYDSIAYPDADIISNYMSLAPNILQRRGTMIMTYGYSGVGKSAALFGVEENPAENQGKKLGILQTTMDQLPDNINIYFRVFEIYGLGTQFDFYWNPSMRNDSIDDTLCFPDLYQMVIHHDLDTNSTVLKSAKSVPITNQADIFAYVMSMQNPLDPNIPLFKKNPEWPNRNPALADAMEDAGGGMNKFKAPYSAYKKINKDHYRNFIGFVDDIERKRRDEGVNYKQVFMQHLLQIKGTVNNDKSSRSILVYDFQIHETDSTGTINYFTPFVIYDLPGKEDLFKTYIDSTPSDPSVQAANRSQFAFTDILGDTDIVTTNKKRIIKERKSSYVLNPLLLPTFDGPGYDNYEIVVQTLKQITLPNAGPNYVGQLINEILDYDLTTHGLDSETHAFAPASSYKIGDLYHTRPTNFDELFAWKNTYISRDIPEDDQPFGITEKGFIEAAFNNNSEQSLFRYVAIVAIGILIKHKLFDVIVKIIYNINQNPAFSAEHRDSWKEEKIYSFFEAYYINENVIGLLHYLIVNILHAPSTFRAQTKKSFKSVIDHNIEFANSYNFFKLWYDLREKETDTLDFDFSEIKIDTELFKVDTDLSPDQQKIDVDNIKEFVNDFGIDPATGIFTNPALQRKQAYETQRAAIEFENKGSYNNNKIFRNNDPNRVCSHPRRPRNQILDPNDDMLKQITNRPLLQDFLEPYSKKVEFYYVFYVISNNKKRLKAEEQIKLLNNSMPFINALVVGEKKTLCVTG